MSVSKALKYDKRVIFRQGEQYKFLLKARKILDLSWVQFSKRIRIPKRTLNDWKREKYSLRYKSLLGICRLSGLQVPNNIKIKSPFWYAIKGARIAGPLVYKKYGRIGGDPEYRKRKWREWWEKEGKYKSSPILNKPFPVKKPRKSKELAEFAGIMIGDGGITNRQITITLNYKTDKDYSDFVATLILKLFKITPSVYRRPKNSTISIVVSRTQLVEFCRSIGLRVGNKLKQKLDIPDWIMENESFKIVCLRGLMDTDGCVFNECHTIKGKEYCYPRWCITSHSPALCRSVYKVLQELGFSPRLRNNRNIQLENRDEILRYFHIVGTRNQNNRRRFAKIFGEVG